MRLAVVCVVLLFVPGLAEAVERNTARLGVSEWVVGAQIPDGAEKVCFVRGDERIACVAAASVTADVVELDGRRFRVTSPTGLSKAAVAKVSLTSTATLRAISCKTQDDFEACSAPSEDVFKLEVLSPPPSPRGVDLEEIKLGALEIRSGEDAIARGRQRIEKAIEAAE